MDENMKALAATAACWLLLAGTASAAGGHHAVDDASMLARGACEQESWFSRAQGGERSLHAGVGCGVGPVELGLGGDAARSEGVSSTAWTLQAKWAGEVAQGLSLGLSVQPVWQARQRPRHVATTIAALASWTPREELAFHLNVGRDVVNGGRDLARGGVAAEWMPAPRWWLAAERYVEERTHFLRAGMRWAAGEDWSLDFSRSHRISGPNPSAWTFGLTIQFGGD